jgi:hypothetical protein
MIVHDDFHFSPNDFLYYPGINFHIGSLENQIEFVYYICRDGMMFLDASKKPRTFELAYSRLEAIKRWLEDPRLLNSSDFRNEMLRLLEESENNSALRYHDWAISSNRGLIASVGLINVIYNHEMEEDRKLFAINQAMIEAVSLIKSCRIDQKIKNNKDKEYLVIANSYFSKTDSVTPFEDLDCKIVYLIDELGENLIFKTSDNLYFLNMNDIRMCRHLGCNSQDELIQKILHGQETFWWFARRWLNRLFP